MKNKILTCALAIAVLGTSVSAREPLSDQQVQAGYREAIHARMSYRPDIAESILTRLVSERPNAPQLRFDLAVSQAEQGDCVRASRTFSHGEDLAKTPSFARAADLAMNDLCPGLAPWETSFGLSFGYDTNINGGSGSERITVNGTEVTLSDDALAKAAYGYTLNGGVAYNHKLGQADYIVPSASLQLRDYEGDEYDELTISSAVSYRHQGDAVDWRVGPSLKWTIDRDGLVDRGLGLTARAAWTITPDRGLYFSASAYDVDDIQNDLNDRTELSLGATYVHAIGIRNMVGRVGVSWNRMDYEGDLQDLDSLRAEIGVSGSVTKKIGFDLSIAHTVNEGSTAHPFFGEVRRDEITTLSAQVSLARFETFLGRPYVGVSHAISNSTFDMKDYDRTSFNFGITRRF